MDTGDFYDFAFFNSLFHFSRLDQNSRPNIHQTTSISANSLALCCRLHPELQLSCLDFASRIEVLGQPFVWRTLQRLVGSFASEAFHGIPPGKVVVDIQHVSGVGHRQLLVTFHDDEIFIVVEGSLMTKVVTPRNYHAVFRKRVNDQNLVVNDGETRVQQFLLPTNGNDLSVKSLSADDSR